VRTIADVKRTIAEIRAGRIARCTRTELLDLCDETEAGIVVRGCAPPVQLSDSEINDGLLRERDELVLRVRDLEERLAAAIRAHDICLQQRDELDRALTEQIKKLEERLSRARAALDGRP
jgi:hypothetical protein